MMTFTRYALRTFLWNFGVMWVSFTSLLQVVDLLNNSDEVLDRHPHDVHAVLEYAIYRLPELAVFLIPFSVLMAALLSLAKFERGNETLALKSAGAPYYQILLAFLPAVGLVAVLHFALTDQVVPRSIDHMMERNLYVDKKAKDNEDDQRV
ncbi:MAG TPA: LptF/LptG family permease, partial [Dongiaceae bacterium]